MSNVYSIFAQKVRSIAPGVTVDVMSHSGYGASVMLAPKLLDNGKTHRLPPGEVIPAIPIHCLPGCPEDWVRDAGSYVIMVEESFGLWFDWRSNDSYTTAVVPSVKGMNPVTGQKLEGCQMEQYRDRCPVHDIPFAHGNYCEKCDYKWPYQNYIARPNTLWWDGFFQSDGTVRQFFYTEDEARDIASLAIGKENTMPAFGFAFFKYKHESPTQEYRVKRQAPALDQGYFPMPSQKKYASKPKFWTNSVTWDSSTHEVTSDKSQVYGAGTGDIRLGDAPFVEDMNDTVDSIMPFISENHNFVSSSMISCSCSSVHTMNSTEERDFLKSQTEERKFRNIMGFDEASAHDAIKEVSIGAGAAIEQDLRIDTRPLESYHEKPQSLIRIYFVFEPQLRQIVANGGIKKINGEKSGFLKGMPVGN